MSSMVKCFMIRRPAPWYVDEVVVGEDQLEAIPLLKVSFYATGYAGIRSGCGPELVSRTARVHSLLPAFIHCCGMSLPYYILTRISAIAVDTLCTWKEMEMVSFVNMRYKVGLTLSPERLATLFIIVVYSICIRSICERHSQVIIIIDHLIHYYQKGGAPAFFSRVSFVDTVYSVNYSNT